MTEPGVCTVALGEPADIPACIDALVCSEIGRRYFRDGGKIGDFIREGVEKGEIWAAHIASGECVGFMWYTLHGAFYRIPYLRNIAVCQNWRGKGVAGALLDNFEAAGFQVASHVMLLVSDFNAAARRLYLKRGYREVGEVEDLFVQGITEQIMVKRRPLAGVR